MNKRLIRLGALFLAILGFLPAFAQSLGMNDGYTRMYGINSRSAAMGGAMVAVAEGIEAIAYNPALLALSKDSTSLQIQTFPSAKLMVNDVNCGPGSAGVVLGMTQKFLRDRIGVGYLLNISAGGGSGGGSSLPLIGGGGYSWPDFQSPSLPLGMGMGIRLHDTLAVGIAPATDLIIRTTEINIPITQVLQGLLGVAIGAPAANVNPGIGLGISPESVSFAIAVAFKPIKYLSLGYINIPMSKVRLRVPLVIRGGGLISDTYTLLINDLSTSPPIEQYGVGVHIPIPKSKLTLAYTYQHLGYGKLYDELYGDYLKYTNPNITDVVSISYSAPAPRKDVNVDRYGIEYIMYLNQFGWAPEVLAKRNAELAIRAGYFYWKTPLPDELWGSDFGNDFQVYSFGLGLKFDRKAKSALVEPRRKNQFAIDLHLQYLTMEDKDYIVQYNYWQQPQGNPTFYYYHTEGEIWALGLEFSWLH